MLVADPSIIVQSSGLKSLEVLPDGQVVIELKNRCKLTLRPIIEDGTFKNYEMIYLSGRESRQIEKKYEQMAKLEEQIRELEMVGLSGSEEGDSDEDGSEEVNEEVNEEVEE